MITIRKAKDRGHANHGWLDTWHTFSFADYYDPEQMGFRTLRVINDDRIAGGGGFATHPHRDMEIITYVLSGQLEHRDSMGNGAVIKPGEVQAMTAGTGIKHSEFNRSSTEPVHLLQIWILPEKIGLQPGYAQKDFSGRLSKGGLVPVVSRSGHDETLKVNQDIELLIGRLPSGGKARHELRPLRHAWLQVAQGGIRLNGNALSAGVGAAVAGESGLDITALDDSHVLVFDLN